MRRHVMKWLVPVAAIAVSASPGQAQLVNYVTQGYFTSPFPGVCQQTAPAGTAAAGASCSAAGFTLAFIPTAGVNISGGQTSLGQFDLTGTGTATSPINGLMFHLVIQQVTPSTGQGTFVGDISGTVSTSAPGGLQAGQCPATGGGEGNCSTLMWTPDAQSLLVGSTTYTLVYDNNGVAAGIGLGIPINNVRGIDAIVTATPEPASMGLFATGLVGLAGFVKRRKRNEAA